MSTRSPILHSVFSVDCVIFGFDEKELNVLLIQRGAEPFIDMPAIAGDLAKMDEDLDESAQRILTELTGLRNIYLEQFQSFGAINRHPWGRIITVAYMALIKKNDLELNPSSWAKEAFWVPLSQIPLLAFDHNAIVEKALKYLQLKTTYSPVGLELLPKAFTLSQMQKLYEAIFEKEMDKRNFRRKISRLAYIKELDTKQEGVAHRAARLYEFDMSQYNPLGEVVNPVIT